jgi:formate dehydrogenase assembly factor FdhD
MDYMDDCHAMAKGLITSEDIMDEENQEDDLEFEEPNTGDTSSLDLRTKKTKINRAAIHRSKNIVDRSEIIEELSNESSIS